MHTNISRILTILVLINLLAIISVTRHNSPIYGMDASISRKSRHDTPIIGWYRSGLLPPIDELLANKHVIVAVITPQSRKDSAVAVSVSDWRSIMLGDKIVQEERERELDRIIMKKGLKYPFTLVEANVDEVLKGNISGSVIQIWEQRGEWRGFQVDSSDPILPPGVRGVLIAGKYHNGAIFPLVFAPIEENEFVPTLDMTLNQLRALIAAER